MSTTLINQSFECACCSEVTNAMPASYDGEYKIICDDCDNSFIWCNVCQTHLYSEDSNPCRHLYWSDHKSEWLGCGIDSTQWHKNANDVKAMCDMIGFVAAIALKQALEHHRYWHQFSGSIFGYDSFRAEWFNPRSGNLQSWGYVFNPIFASDAEDTETNRAIAHGINWIASLWSEESLGWKSETAAADLLTAKWIDEWLASR